MIAAWVVGGVVLVLLAVVVVVLLRRQYIAKHQTRFADYTPSFAQRRLRDPDITEPLPVVTGDSKDVDDEEE